MQCAHQVRGGAVGIGGDESLPAPLSLLTLDQPDMFRVDLGDQQRHVRLVAVGAGVAAYDVAGRGQRPFDGARGFAGQGAEYQLAVDARRHLLQGPVAQVGRHVPAQEPVAGVGIAFARVALRRAQHAQLKPGMTLQHLYKPLPHRAGRTQHAHSNLRLIELWESCHRNQLHNGDQRPAVSGLSKRDRENAGCQPAQSGTAEVQFNDVAEYAGRCRLNARAAALDNERVGTVPAAVKLDQVVGAGQTTAVRPTLQAPSASVAA